MAYISSNVLKNIDKNTEYANDEEVFKTASKENTENANDEEVFKTASKESDYLLLMESYKQDIKLSDFAQDHEIDHRKRNTTESIIEIDHRKLNTTENIIEINIEKTEEVIPLNEIRTPKI